MRGAMVLLGTVLVIVGCGDNKNAQDKNTKGKESFPGFTPTGPRPPAPSDPAPPVPVAPPPVEVVHAPVVRADLPRLTPQVGHWNAALAYSADGEYLVTTGFFDLSVRLWNAKTGALLRSYPGYRSRDYDRGKSIGISADGKTLVVGYGFGPAIVWDNVSGKRIREWEYVGQQVAVSRRADLILTGSRSVEVRTLQSQKTIRELSIGGKVLKKLALSPDDSLILAATEGTVFVFKATDVRPLHEFPITSDPRMATFSRDGKRIVVGDESGAVHIRDALSGVEISTRRVTSLRFEAFSPDGLHALRNDGKLVTLADHEPATVLKDVYSFGNAAFSPDGSVLALAELSLSGSGPTWNAIHVFDTKTGELKLKFPDSRRCDAVAYEPNRQLLLSAANAKDRHIRDLRFGRVVPLEDTQDGSMSDAAFSPDGSTLAIALGSKKIRLFDAATGKVGRLLEGHTESISALSFSPDGKFLLTGDRAATARLWNVATGAAVHVLTGHSLSVSEVAFDPTGRWMLTQDLGNNKWRVWNVETGQPVSECKFSGIVHAVAFSPDGMTVASGNNLNGFDLWDAASGRLIRECAHDVGIGNRVGHIAFTSDGTRVLAAHSDGIRTWDVATGHPLRHVVGEFGRCLGFNRELTRMVCHSENTFRVIDTATGRELCSLISFPDGNWIVVDHENRFDASDGIATTRLVWVVGFETVPLAKNAASYFDPGLLAKHLGLDARPPRAVKPFAP